MTRLLRPELNDLVRNSAAEAVRRVREGSPSSLQCIGVEASLGSAFICHVSLVAAQLPSALKPTFQSIASRLRDVVLPDTSGNAGSGDSGVLLGDHGIDLKAGVRSPARYFYIREASVVTPDPDDTDVVLRVWGFTADPSATPFGPLTIRETLERLRWTLQGRLHTPTLDLFADAIRGGATTEALAVLARVLGVDGLVLWQYDETKRRFRSVATVGLGSRPLNVPFTRYAGHVRKGIVSQVTPGGPMVVYDTMAREHWQPKFDGQWEPFDRDLLRTRNWRSSLVVPVERGGRLIGALAAYSQQPAIRLAGIEASLRRAAAGSAAAVLLERDRTVLAELKERYEKELLTSNVSLSALSLSHDVMHYYRSVIVWVDQCQGYLATGQLQEAQAALENITTTMASSKPVIEAMQKLASEAAEAQSGTRLELTHNPAEVLLELEPLLKAILPHYSRGNRLSADRVTVTISGRPRMVLMAPESLERVVMNLCINAAQWRASIVSVHAHFDRSSTEMQLVVRDDGRGIPESQRERVFDRFFTSRNGSGLGLYVVKTLAQRAGGEVHLQSHDVKDTVEHRGTTVTVVVPTAHESESTEPRVRSTVR